MTAPMDPDAALTLTCETSDPYDASIRLLIDAQRFGMRLVSLNVSPQENALSLTVLVPPGMDRHNLADRFGRHRAILRISAEDRN